MNAQPRKSHDSSDLATLLCLLQSYEQYGNLSAPPHCLRSLRAAEKAA